MNRTQARVVVSMLAIAILILIPAMSLASQIINVDIPISGAVMNPCNGETLTFSGVDHFVATLTFDARGGIHVISHDNIHVTASGSDGNSYEGNQEVNNEFNAKFGVENTLVFTFSEISKGSAPNFEMNILEHITVNPNGTVTVFFSNMSANCRG
jgi:hypothetical protein